jgi:hypothetical protein
MSSGKNKLQLLFSFVFLACALLSRTGGAPAEASGVKIFYTPSVEPLFMEEIPATKIPSGSPDKNDRMGLHLRTGEIFTSPDLLPQQLGRRGMQDFGLASIEGSGDLMAIWITRDDESLYQLVAVDNHALYGIRDPVTGQPIGTGFIDRLDDWETLRGQRSELMAESAGSIPSVVGAGAASAGSVASVKGSGLFGFFLGGLDILGGILERYIRSGRIYWKMVDTEQDLENLFFEAQRIEVQQSGGSS